MTADRPPALLNPPDSHNARLVANVHPLNWQNPTPARCYNLVVIGAQPTHTFHNRREVHLGR